MHLKYRDKIKQIDRCPPNPTRDPDGEAFRYIHEDIDDERNFEPPAIIKPGRRFPPEELCCAYALSFFDTREAAIQNYLELKKNLPQIGKLVGTHLASIELEEEDGIATEPEDDGHFDLFQAESADLTSRAEIIEELPHATN